MKMKTRDIHNIVEDLNKAIIEYRHTHNIDKKGLLSVIPLITKASIGPIKAATIEIRYIDTVYNINKAFITSSYAQRVLTGQTDKEEELMDICINLAINALFRAMMDKSDDSIFNRILRGDYGF